MTLVLPDTSGLAQGITQAGNAFAQALQQANKQRKEQNVLKSILGTSKQESAEDFDQRFLNLVQDYEKETGQDLTPNQLDFMWKAFSQQRQQPDQSQPYSDKQINAALATGKTQLASAMINRNSARQKEESLDKNEQEYVKSIQDGFTSAKKSLGLIKRIESKLDKAEIGPLTLSRFDPNAQTIQSEVGTLFKIYSDLYKGGRITDQKFKYIKDTLLPSLYDTREVFQRKLDAFKEMANEDFQKGNKLLDIKKQRGRIPKDIFDILESPEEDTDASISIETPQEAIKANQTIQVGKRYVNPQTGQRIEWTGSGWRQVK